MINKVNDYKKTKLSTSFVYRIKGKDTKFTISPNGLAIRIAGAALMIPKEVLEFIVKESNND